MFRQSVVCISIEYQSVLMAFSEHRNDENHHLWLILQPDEFTNKIIQRSLSARRLFSISPQRSNLVSDLYIQQIKAFKPTPLSNKDAESSIKSFQLPNKPSVPESEISADALSQYESSDVETAAAEPSSAVEPAAEEDWFVFEEEEVHH